MALGSELSSLTKLRIPRKSQHIFFAPSGLWAMTLDQERTKAETWWLWEEAEPGCVPRSSCRCDCTCLLCGLQSIPSHGLPCRLLVSRDNELPGREESWDALPSKVLALLFYQVGGHNNEKWEAANRLKKLILNKETRLISRGLWAMRPPPSDAGHHKRLSHPGTACAKMRCSVINLPGSRAEKGKRERSE